MIRRAPRCCECSYGLLVIEPFTGGVGQCVRCPGCGVQLIVRRVPEDWHVRTMADFKRQRTAPLPAVATVQLRRRFRNACAVVARFVARGGTEPGEASLQVSATEAGQ